MCQNANVSVKLAFDYRSKCILLKFKHWRPIVLQFRRLVDMNLKQHFVYSVTMIIENENLPSNVCSRFSKKRKTFRFCENVLSVWSFFPETLTFFWAPVVFCFSDNSLQSVETHRIFPLLIAVVKTIRIHIKAIQPIFIEAGIRTFEIRIPAWCKRN